MQPVLPLCRTPLRTARGPLRLRGILDRVGSVDDGTERSVHRVRATKRANSSGSTIATAKDRRAFSAYLPRGSRLALEKSTSGISRSERLVGSVSFGIGSPFALRGSSGTDDPNDTAGHHLREHQEERPAELRLTDQDQPIRT